jgi:lipopolysaccharide transport system ATP-binding protein
MKPAIVADNLSKRYRLGDRPNAPYGTLRESVMGAARSARDWAARLGRPRPDAGPDGRDRGSVWALKDVSFSVRPGEAVGVVGRNGAGKSTLLKVLSRITPPTEGGAELRGRVSSLLEVGTGFHPELTGRENVYLNGAIIGMGRREIERKFDRIVEFAEIGPFLDTPVKRYSSGMYVRLAFSVAAHTDPDILVIDEVLSVGDLAFQRKCLDHARRLLERDVTLLFVSHNMFSIKSMCKRSLYLSGGRLRHDGPTEEVIRLYEQENRLDTPAWAQKVVGGDPARCPVHVTNVELLEEGGSPRVVFDHGERMRVRLHYRTDGSVERPNFNVCFLRSDNVACCNYNTAMDQASPSPAGDRGVLELWTPPLKLVAEMYAVQVLVWDPDYRRLYSAQEGPSFHVRHDLLDTQFGVFHEPAEWRWAAAH